MITNSFRFLITLRNLILFTICAIEAGIPIHQWSYAYQQAKEWQQQKIHKAIWELKKQGKVYEDENGLLWPKDES